uniref:Uncharacterized protein n=1 Tax=Rhizophora mucronata TaxID=61149 RepID=A0A2P2IH08_RHIMU
MISTSNFSHQCKTKMFQFSFTNFYIKKASGAQK